MHNPLVVLSLAAYCTLLHVGMMIAMPIAMRGNGKPSGPVHRRRAMAAALAYVVGIVAAVVFGIQNRRRARTHATFWAVILLLLFGLSYAVYSAVPKVYAEVAAPEDMQRRARAGRAATVVHAIALVGAIIVYFAAVGLLKKLPS